MNRKVPAFMVYFAVAFGAICFIPWGSSKTGDFTINVASVYANGLSDWQTLLVGHITSSLILAAGGVLLDRTLRRLLARNRP